MYTKFAQCQTQEFEFCNCTSLFFTCCHLLNNYFQIYWKNWKFCSVKLIRKRTNVRAAWIGKYDGNEVQNW